MNATLRHRGPDDEGVWVAGPGVREGWTNTSGEVGLAQRRLSIIDLSPAGHGPMPNDDGTLWITYNGEVYNFREVRAELESAGFRFRSQTDTEVVLRAYEKWGRECLERFVGMFAFAIWDSRRRTLFAARDRLGIKPFYYLRKAAEFAFASELKALHLHPAFDGEIDREAVRQYLRFQYVPSPSSIYRSVRKLPPGHWLELSQDGNLAVQRYWDPLAIALRPATAESEAAIFERFEALLAQSVRYRMIADVPLGAFLSGGVDSSTVVALMQEIATARVKTFSIGFEERSMDEAPYARAVARHLKTEHHEKICTFRDALELIPLVVRHYDEPFGDSSAIPTMLVSRFAREHVTVALSGDGGDELFWGYSRYFAYRRMRQFLGAPRWIRHMAGRMLSLVPDRRFRRAGMLAAEEGSRGDWYVRFVKILAQEEIVRLTGLAAHDPDFYREAVERLGPIRQDEVSVRDLVSYLPEDILTKVDRASMAFSLEARVPLLDHRLVEFSLSLPFSLKYRNRQGKYLLRKALYRRVPRDLIDRPKMGFGVPLRRWYEGALRDSLREVLSDREVARAGLVEPSAVRALLAPELDLPRRRPEVIWCLYMLHLWAAEAAGSAAEARAEAESAAAHG